MPYKSQFETLWINVVKSPGWKLGACWWYARGMSSSSAHSPEMDVFDSEGIDWSRSPASPHEAKLRAAFLKQLIDRRKSSGAGRVYFALQSLAGFQSAGEDLQAALSEWREKFSHEAAEHKRSEYSELLELARAETQAKA